MLQQQLHNSVYIEYVIFHNTQ